MPQRTLIVIPTYNERDNIGALADRLLELHPEVDILVVDDGSPDGTADAVREAEKRHGSHVRLFSRNGKGGRGAAVLEGFKKGLAEGYDLLFEMDADFSHSPDDMAKFFEKIADADVVVGSRYLPGSTIRDWGWKRTIFSRWANRYARAVLRIPMSDYTNGYRLYTHEAIAAIDMQTVDAKGYVVLSEVAYLLHNKGFKIADVPTTFVNRRRGISNLTGNEMSEAFFSVLRIRAPKLAQHVRQGFHFAFAGSIGACIDLGSLPLLVEYAHVPKPVAFVLSSTISVTFVFFFNKYVTFANRKTGAVGNQVMKFILVYGTAIALNGIMSSLFLWLGAQYIVAKVLAIGFGMIWNYVLSNSFVFAHKKP